MTPSSAILIAAGGDWLGVLVPIVFFVIYVLNQLLSAKGNRPTARNPQRPAGGRVERPLRPPQPPGGPQAGAPQAGGQAQLNAEIEQFLKRAGQRRGERPPRERATRTPAPAPPTAPPRTQCEKPLDVQPIEPAQLGSVAASVEKHLANRGFEQRAEHLADDITLADQQMEEHVQKAFGHRVGTLAADAAQASASPATDVASVVTTEPSSLAAGLAAVLASPQGMRQAVILSEILQRPEHRW